MSDLLPRALTAGVLTGLVGYLFMVLSSITFATLLCALLVYILVAEWPRFNAWWLTPFYPVVPFLALVDLYLMRPDAWAWLVVVVAAYDTGGYIFGKFFGTLPIAPKISSGKTVQGFLGGVLFAGFISTLFACFLQKSLYSGTLITYCMGLCIGIIAFFGDLLESYLKRRAGLKDSGYILPGHGGVLDRIDGLLLAALVMDIFLTFFR
jgi:phosphatidate cytidylyltransferase